MLNNKKAKKNRTEEEKKMARELNEAIAAAEKEAEAESDYEQLSPAEQLSADIAAHLADNAAHRIGKILENTDYDAAKQLVIRFENSDSRTVVSMIRAILLSHGMKHAAEELDILTDCDPFDSEAYDAFSDEFLGSEPIDWFTVETWIIETASDDGGEVIGWLRS